MSDVALNIDMETAKDLLVLLTANDPALRETLDVLRCELEATLYRRLSIEEMERVMERAEAARGI